MKTFLASIFLLVFSYYPNAMANDQVSAETILAPFHQAVQESIDPWEEGQDMTELTMEAAKLADKHILGLEKELHKVALAEMKQLKKRDYNLDDYETRFESDVDIMTILLGQGSPVSSGMLIYQFWNPKQAAHQYKMFALSREVKGQAIGIHVLRDRFAPPETFLVRSDPLRPKLAIESGLDVCFVELEYDEHGFYKMKSIRFTKKKR